MLPVYPISVSVVLLVPDVTVPAPVMVPEAEPTARLIDCVVVELPLALDIVIVPV